MQAFINRFTRLFQSSSPVPVEYRAIFKHLYMDIAWFGILSGSTIAFLAVYATRSGATDTQIGMLSAAPALVNLLFALPAGTWLSRRSVGRAVFWTSVIQRVFYLGLIPLPVLLLPHTQVWVILLMTLLMNIPGTAMVVGFNSQFGELVPLEWRGHVAGIRNALLSIISTVFTLISGWILDRVTFPGGYQIVFTIGILGAGMSSLHLFFLSRLAEKHAASCENGSGALQPRGSPRGLQALRLDPMRGPYGRIMALLFGWHLFQFMSIPTVTLYLVNYLHLSDQLIGLGSGIFNLTVFIGSLALNRATTRYGSKTLTGAGVAGLSLFPILTSLGLTGYIAGSIWGGLAWAMAGGAIYNYILENVPAGDRPAYLAWYSLVSNAAILIGSLSGPALATIIGPATALVLIGIGRGLAGLAILKWG